MTERKPGLARADAWIALIVGLCGLFAYLRTLAPDVLYSDSAEFQTLAYILDTTHSTGYPIYLLMGRLIGFVPIGSPAVRISLLSALCAAVALGCIYLATRYVTSSRAGAVLASVALGLSYTFWSQAIIAEVYTPSLAVLTPVVLLAFHWHSAPSKRNWALLLAGLLIGLGLGVHASVGLFGPALAVLVIWTLGSQRAARAQWLRAMGAAALGLAIGVGTFVLTFVLIDLNDSPASFIQTTVLPSRSIWGLTPADLDSPFERMWVTVTGLQWRDAMFPQNTQLGDAIGGYLLQVSRDEFSPLALVLAMIGFVVMLRRFPQLGGFNLIAFVTSLFLVLNYRPGDQYIFFLSTYVPVVIALGAGAGWMLEQVQRRMASRPASWQLAVMGAASGLLALVIVAPAAGSRLNALQTGAATFVRQDYVYPIDDLAEPRRASAERIAQLPEGALAITDWRAMYSMFYLAHVEGMRPDVAFMEATPHGSDGRVADSLIETMKAAMQSGRTVVTDNDYRNLQQHFRLEPLPGGAWYRVTIL
jgi:hypothetical protein